MNLRELFESRSSDVAIIFGRFNPPHFGHAGAWKVASNFDNWYVGTNQSTQGPKDPLPFNMKIAAMKTVMPELEGHVVAEQSWLTLAVMVYKKFGESVSLHVVTDPKDAKVFVPLLQDQNGKEGPHGYYKFKSVEWAKADRSSEATLVRNSIRENNPKDFEKYAGVPPDTLVAGVPYFNLVRKYMLPYMEAEEAKARADKEREQAKADKARLKAEKDAAKLDKKKIKQPDTQGMAEDAEPVDREFHLVKKLGRLGERIAQNPKLWDKYSEAIDNDDSDWVVSLIQEGTGATYKEVLHLSDLFGEIGGGLGRIVDFAWAVKEGTWEEDFLNPYRQYRKQAMQEFAPAGGGNPPRGPKNKGRDPWDDDSGEDPYSRPEPEYYNRSIDFFGRFEADHFDDEVFNEKTGVFKGYWDDEEGRIQIAYFKFDDPENVGSDDPGMGWYYEPQNESVAETARMSAAAKLSKAWDRQQAKSAASRKRGQELLNPPKKEEPKTQQPVSEKFHIFKRFKKTRK